jgi:hypothetical protein
LRPRAVLSRVPQPTRPISLCPRPQASTSTALLSASREPACARASPRARHTRSPTSRLLAGRRTPHRGPRSLPSSLACTSCCRPCRRLSPPRGLQRERAAAAFDRILDWPGRGRPRPPNCFVALSATQTPHLCRLPNPPKAAAPFLGPVRSGTSTWLFPNTCTRGGLGPDCFGGKGPRAPVHCGLCATHA